MRLGRWSAAAAGLAWTLLAAACGSEDGASAPFDAATDAGEDQDTGEADVSTEAGEVGVPNDDGEAAAPHPCLTAKDAPSSGIVSGSLDPMTGEADFYRLSLSAGELVVVTGDATGNLKSLANPVLTLYSDDGTEVLATDDDSSALFLPQGYPDSIWGPAGELRSAGQGSFMAYRAVTDMTVCIRLEDRSTWLGVPEPDAPRLDYYVGITNITEDLGCHDTEPNDSAATPWECMRSIGSGELLVTGLLDTQDDVDVVRIPPSDTEMVVDLAFNLPGPGGPGVDGSGSTLLPGRVDLTDESGNVLARADATLGVTELYALVPAKQSTLLWIRRAPGSAVGANDFYFLYGGETEPDLLNKFGEEETVAGENDTPDTAQANTPGLDSVFGYAEWVAHGFIHETAPGDPVDVDYWAVQGYAGGSLLLRCWSARVGSGVVDAHFAILDRQGNVLREGVETKDRDFAWRDDPFAVAPPLALPDSGTYYLRVTAGGQDPDVSSRAYVCAVNIGVP